MGTTRIYVIITQIYIYLYMYVHVPLIVYYEHICILKHMISMYTFSTLGTHSKPDTVTHLFY